MSQVVPIAAAKSEFSKPVLPCSLSDADLADELGELCRLDALWKPKKDRMEALRAEVRKRFETQPADQSGDIEGQSWRIQVSPKKKERKWLNIFDVYRKFRRDDFLAICSVPLGKVEDAIGKSAVAKLTVEERTGYRELTPVLIAAPLKPAA